MKAIMKTIKPKTCANVMNNKQSILVIKNKKEAKAIQKLIVEYGYADIYVHCSKDNKNYLYWDWWDPPYVEEEWFVSSNPKIWSEDRKNINGWFNGKVLFKFRCYEMEEIPNYGLARRSETMMEELLKGSCLTMGELNKYAPHKEYDDDDYIYAIHINDLKIFDEPKELSEFRKSNTPSYEQTKPFAEIFSKSYTQEEYKKQCERFGFVLIKAPKNFCYVEVE